eukprot:TRINITY_DN5244_c0_g1_i3.p1 TRINITY_DN5244_c0_g1~~TRINITY_DN5244_c0_g1_i3.p1  ORF type:complete len:170 (+),score=19.58 TRINITY_DN5244_c0_g1_i3:152-661(+)
MIKRKLTTNLRTHDAGYFVIGVKTNTISLPPAKDIYQIDSYCQSDVPPGDYHVFASGLHMHTLGRQIWTEHFRNINGTSVKISNIGCDDFFDFNQQRFTPLDAVIRPGDSFITHCVWDTSSKSVNTKGCESPACEMCLNFLPYYPKVETDECLGEAIPVSNPQKEQHCS